MELWLLLYRNVAMNNCDHRRCNEDFFCHFFDFGHFAWNFSLQKKNLLKNFQRTLADKWKWTKNRTADVKKLIKMAGKKNDFFIFFMEALDHLFHFGWSAFDYCILYIVFFVVYLRYSYVVWAGGRGIIVAFNKSSWGNKCPIQFRSDLQYIYERFVRNNKNIIIKFFFKRLSCIGSGKNILQ